MLSVGYWFSPNTRNRPRACRWRKKWSQITLTYENMVDSGQTTQRITAFRQASKAVSLLGIIKGDFTIPVTSPLPERQRLVEVACGDEATGARLSPKPLPFSRLAYECSAIIIGGRPKRIHGPG